MHTATGMWVTPHGIKKLERERSQLRIWLDRIRMRLYQVQGDRQNKDIDLILSEGRVVEDRLQRVDAVLDRARTLPPAWGHKVEARAGDAVYLRHKDTIRSVLLVAAWNADPQNGKVSVVSPLGHALLGRHLGDRLRLDTLDGKLTYEVVKII